ncbi:hypothetical protein AAVH_18336 [Aphelenchoides avenae]|nr:hypothetical protein AAVH_18336 [Aphelenchus avenae]
MLPTESLLVALHSADYKTLILAKLATARFLRLIDKFAHELEVRRRFRVDFCATCIEYEDVTIRARSRSIRFEPGNRASLASACRYFAGVIGPHSVANLTFTGSAWNMGGVGAVFAYDFLLKYAENVDIYWPNGSTSSSINPEAFLYNFVGMKMLRLSLGYDTFRQLNWTFLRKELAREW